MPESFNYCLETRDERASDNFFSVQQKIVLFPESSKIHNNLEHINISSAETTTEPTDLDIENDYTSQCFTTTKYRAMQKLINGLALVLSFPSTNYTNWIEEDLQNLKTYYKHKLNFLFHHLKNPSLQDIWEFFKQFKKSSNLPNFAGKPGVCIILSEYTNKNIFSLVQNREDDLEEISIYEIIIRFLSSQNFCWKSLWIIGSSNKIEDLSVIRNQSLNNFVFEIVNKIAGEVLKLEDSTNFYIVYSVIESSKQGSFFVQSCLKALRGNRKMDLKELMWETKRNLSQMTKEGQMPQIPIIFDTLRKRIYLDKPCE